MNKKFTKNDSGFICAVCGQTVKPLKSSSRDHCTHCLCSLHVDVNPGDRANLCGGIMVPVFIEYNSKKGYVINYECSICHTTHRNVTAPDDEQTTILAVSNHTYNVDNYKK